MTTPNPAAEPTPASDGAAAAVPMDGDVLVTRDPSAIGRHWISRVPRLPLIVAGADVDAIRLAREVARARGVGLWYGDRGAYWRIDTDPAPQAADGRPRGRY